MAERSRTKKKGFVDCRIHWDQHGVFRHAMSVLGPLADSHAHAPEPLRPIHPRQVAESPYSQ